MPSHQELAELWLHAPPGRFSAKEQLRAVALRDAMQEFDDESVNCEWIASKLNVGGGGPPSRQAVRMLLSKADNDKEWYPVKSYQTQQGRPPLLTKAKRRAIAIFTMAAKKRGHEPSIDLAVHFCPTATLNHLTNTPFTAKYLRRSLHGGLL